MPTVLRADRYTFFFYSREYSGSRLEPRHIHVHSGGAQAKVWLGSVEVAESYGFSPPQKRTIRKLVKRNRARFKEAWDEFFREPPSQST